MLASASLWAFFRSSLRKGRKFVALLLLPLLAQLCWDVESPSWWLLDSGAAVSVLAEANLKHYKVLEWLPVEDQFSAANGSAVQMVSKARIELALPVKSSCDPERATNVIQKFSLEVYIGKTQHNILSMVQLANRGWLFTLGFLQQSLAHEKFDLSVRGLVFWGGCPWIQSDLPDATPHPSHLPTNVVSELCVVKRKAEEREVSLEVGADASSDDPGVGLAESGAPVEPSTSVGQMSGQETLVHRMRGHVPFNPFCMQCLKAKAVKQHRRRRTRQEVASLVADFLFIGPAKRKALVIVEVVTHMLACAPVHENVDRTRALLKQWFAEFALDGVGHKCALEVFTDAEIAVGNLLKSVETGTRLSVRKAPPQAHEVVGLAERFVRYVEETVAVLKDDLKQTFHTELVDTSLAWEVVLQYVSCTYNRFGAPGEQKMAPLELLMGKRLPEAKSTLLGCTVLAELPESVVRETRFEEAAYLGHALNSLGHRVSTFVNDEPRVFVAKSIRLLAPLRLKPELAPVLFGAGDFPKMSLPQTKQTVFEPAKLSGNPPAAWFEVHGRTPGCIACDKGFRGHVHGKACKARYLKWYSDHGNELSGSTPSAPEQQREQVVSPPAHQLPEQTALGDGPAFRIRGKTGPNPQVADAADIEMATAAAAPSSSSREVGPSHRVTGKTAPGASPPLVVADASAETTPSLDNSQIPPFMPLAPSPVEHDSAQDAALREDCDMIDVEVRPCSPTDTQEQAKSTMDVDSLVAYNLGQADLDEQSAVAFVQKLLFCYALYFSAKPESVEFTLCGSQILVAKPQYCVADGTGLQLSPAKTFEGMLVELHALNEFRAGKPLSQAEVDEYRGNGVKVIPTRWVLNPKPSSEDPEKVRSRLVVKEIVRKGDQTARQLAISSPTVHLETFRTLVAYAALLDLCLVCPDVSTAFMASELDEKHRVIVQMPPGCCYQNGWRVHMLLYKALNGLRVAGLAWSNKLCRVITALGLVAGSLECNLYTGFFMGVWIVLLAYVDDLLVVCPKEATGLAFLAELQKHLKVRHTGTLLPSSLGSSRIDFLGRVLERFAGDRAIYMSMPPDYLQPCFDAFQISKASDSVPGIDKILEDDSSAANVQLSPEATTRYRSVLGRLAWFAQVRGDLSIFVMLLSTGQSCPLFKHEKALRAILRFLRSCEHLALRYPSAAQDSSVPVVAFTDASWAPLEYLKRRSISGGYIFAFGSLVKHWSHVQQIVATSSCESEVAAIAVMVAEISCVTDVVVHVCGPDVPAPEVHTDAQSARIVLLSKGETRQSRHFSIKCHMIRQKLADNEVILKWQPGVQLLADMGTKVLPTSKHMFFRSLCGYVELQTSIMNALLTAVPSVLR